MSRNVIDSPWLCQGLPILTNTLIRSQDQRRRKSLGQRLFVADAGATNVASVIELTSVCNVVYSTVDNDRYSGYSFHPLISEHVC